MVDIGKPALHRATTLGYAPAQARQHRPWRETLLLVRYQARLLNWWFLLLVALGFLAAGFLVWLPAHATGAQVQSQALDLSRFTLEPGAGLLAALLASSLIVNDPALEVTLATRAGASEPALWRGLLIFVHLLLCSAAFLAWTLLQGVNYAPQQHPLALALLWLAPALVMGMLGLLGSLLTRNATLGLGLAVIPLAGSLFLYAKLVTMPATHPFLVSYTTSGGANAADWWTNRWTLLGAAAALALWNGWLLRHEERLLNSGQ